MQHRRHSRIAEYNFLVSLGCGIVPHYGLYVSFQEPLYFWHLLGEGVGYVLSGQGFKAVGYMPQGLVRLHVGVHWKYIVLDLAHEGFQVFTGFSE